MVVRGEPSEEHFVEMMKIIKNNVHHDMRYYLGESERYEQYIIQHYSENIHRSPLQDLSPNKARAIISQIDFNVSYTNDVTLLMMLYPEKSVHIVQQYREILETGCIQIKPHDLTESQLNLLGQFPHLDLFEKYEKGFKSKSQINDIKNKGQPISFEVYRKYLHCTAFEVAAFRQSFCSILQIFS